MTALFVYPPAARRGDIIPKDRIDRERAGGASLRAALRERVERIVWREMLTEETMNLLSTARVPAIQVFEIVLRGADPGEDLLRAIDRTIPSPIMFELVDGPRRCATAAPKRPSEAEVGKWVLGPRLWGPWQAADAPRNPLPVATDLERLYERMMAALVPEMRAEDTLADGLARKAALEAKQREIDRLAARVKREKQFNRKVELHEALRAAQAAFDQMADEE